MSDLIDDLVWIVRGSLCLRACSVANPYDEVSERHTRTERELFL